tara:strand:- start:198 stop:416 length:219 start_codon:yes stop_codon:yes gene_type:complete
LHKSSVLFDLPWGVVHAIDPAVKLAVGHAIRRRAEFLLNLRIGILFVFIPLILIKVIPFNSTGFFGLFKLHT